jgi:hypothetical protein
MKRLPPEVIDKQAQIARWIKRSLKSEGFLTDCVAWEGTCLAIRLRITPDDSLGVVMFPLSICKKERKQIEIEFKSQIQTVIANTEWSGETFLPMEYDYTEF